MNSFCLIAVSSATYSIDKPYTYHIPDRFLGRVEAGIRVMVPFGKGNRFVEGLVLSTVDKKSDIATKDIYAVLDDHPIINGILLQLALWMHEQYFCTVYEAVKAMIPSGLFYSLKDEYYIPDSVDCDLVLRSLPNNLEHKFFSFILERGKRVDKKDVGISFVDGNPARPIRELQKKGFISVDTEASRAVGDKTERYAVLAIPYDEAILRISKRAGSQHAIVTLLNEHPRASFKDIRYFTGASTAAIHALEEKGIISTDITEVYRRPYFHQMPSCEPPSLNDEQSSCYEGLVDLFNSGKPSCSLLYGVTGSGKTQVYIRLIHEVLKQNRTALVLVPEIALTPQMLSIFSAQFGSDIAVLHSMLSTGERYDEWKRVRNGKARVVIGTRSAIFAPLQNIGIIILDEEQESSYKSDSSPRYHARDVAKYRAYKEKAILILGSATPSIESMYYAQTGKYHLFTMAKRFNQKAMPKVIISDIKQQLRGGSDFIIGPELEAELRDNIELGQQSILFINRRGSNKMIICSECGDSPQCPKCTARLTYHKANGRMMCHYCGYSEKLPPFCPSCGGNLSFSGAGTQKVQEEIENLFPGTEVIRMDADTVSASLSHEKILNRFRLKRIPVLVGTQMVAKGLDFANVTLVGVVSADQSLYVDDYRAAERTFSLLTQVIGRSGRGEQSGRAVVQTYTPDNDVIRNAADQDYDRFYKSEIQIRESRGLPPFRDLYLFTISGKNESAVLRTCMRVKDGLNTWKADPIFQDCDIQVLGPAAAPVLKVNDKYRYRITVLGKKSQKIRNMVAFILKASQNDNKNRGVTVFADYNPLD